MTTNQPKHKFELLVDADSLLYSAAVMAETEVEWDIDDDQQDLDDNGQIKIF